MELARAERERIALLMRSRLPASTQAWHANLLGRCLINHVLDHGDLPGRLDFMEAYAIANRQWHRWTRLLERAGVITCHYGGIGFPDGAALGRAPVSHDR